MSNIWRIMQISVKKNLPYLTNNASNILDYRSLLTKSLFKLHVWRTFMEGENTIQRALLSMLSTDIYVSFNFDWRNVFFF